MNVLQMSIAGAVMIAIVVIVRALSLHKLPKRLFVVLWGLIAVRLLIPFSIPLPFHLSQIIAEWWTPSADTALSSPLRDILVTQPGIAAADATAVQLTPLLIIWGIGALLLLVAFAAIYWRGHRRFRVSLPMENRIVERWLGKQELVRPLAVHQSDRIASPLTYGFLRPVILLPKTMDWTNRRQMEYVLTHEMIHIRRGDGLLKLVFAAALCMHWFNPLVWVMFILANRDIELACDEAVVRTYSEEDKSSYALALIDMEERKSCLTSVYSHFSKNSLEERITSLMNSTIKKTSAIFGGVVTLALIIGIMVFLASSPSALNAADEPPVSDMANTGEVMENVTPEQFKAWMEEQLATSEQLVKDGKLSQENLDKERQNYEETLRLIEDGAKVSIITTEGGHAIAIGSEGAVDAWGVQSEVDGEMGTMSFKVEENDDGTAVTSIQSTDKVDV